MKYLSILVLSVICISSFSQSLEERIVTDFCNCFNQLEISNDIELTLNKFQDKCFKEVLLTHKQELEELADTITSVPDYQKGYYLGHFVGSKSMSLMVGNCEEFYMYIDQRLTEIVNSADNKDLNRKIDSLSSELKVNQSIQLFFLRASNYYGLKKYNRAIRDIEKVIKDNDKHAGAYMIRGVIYLSTNEYELALTDFELAKSLTDSPKVDLFIALAKRKIKK